uniref:Protein GrpE n=1 Tax=Candidatus Methanophagaceae archaeon ANME-1 ERB6 TaxID=2759912 RepID=A0A7G9YTN6_9EURY|nr:protein GrpE [Methanosarcinales archaeon ANME-1 ERB6]
MTEVQKKEQEQKEEAAKEVEEVEAEVTSTELETLKKELEEKTKLADDYLSQLKYLQADFENYKKMVAREREMYEMCATEELTKSLLPLIDNLEIAIASAKQNEDRASFVEGIELIYKDLMAVLGEEGLKSIKAVGEKLDPYKHEVIMTVIDNGLQEDTVLEEIEKGYMLGSKLIRTAKVKVSKNSP